MLCKRCAAFLLSAMCRDMGIPLVVTDARGNGPKTIEYPPRGET